MLYKLTTSGNMKINSINKDKVKKNSLSSQDIDTKDSQTPGDKTT